jgi:L-idonate 5-dehydrogenase
MQFFGSAMRKPHCNGGFRDEMIVEDFQCEPVGDVGMGEAACAEPLSVGLHAINNAGSVFGKRVLVVGAGPIGALLIGAAKHAGAQEIAAVDLADAPLAAATQMGATSTINAGNEPDQLARLYSADKGYFDAGFECTGVGVALGNMFPVVKPRGTIVAVGVSSGAHIPFNALVGKEIRLAGTHRFHAEYPIAARLIAERRIDVRPIITATLPMEHIREAFDVVRDRSSQLKVQLSFAP